MPLIAAAVVGLAGCAAEPLRPVERLTPEQLAAIPLPGNAKAAEATRITQQADREAQAARATQQQRALELEHWREYDRRYNWSLGLGYSQGYRRPWGWGGGYYFR